MEVSEPSVPNKHTATDKVRNTVDAELNSLVSPCKKLKLGPPLLCSTLLQTPDAKASGVKPVRSSSAPLCCSTPLPVQITKKSATESRESGVGALKAVEEKNISRGSDVRNGEHTEVSAEGETVKPVAGTDDLNDLDINDTLKETESDCNDEPKQTDAVKCGTEKDFSDHLIDAWNIRAEANGFIETDKEKNQRLEGSLEFKDSGVCFQESVRESTSVIKINNCKGLSIRDPNIIREVEKPVNRNIVLDTYMSKENFINEDHLPVPKTTRTKVKKFIEYSGPGFTTTFNSEQAGAGKESKSNDDDIRTCKLQEYSGPGLTSLPEGKAAEFASNPNVAKDCNMLASKIPKGQGIFVDNIPVQESAKATIYQVLKDYNMMSNTSSQSGSEQQTSGSTLRQFTSGSSSTLKPDEAYPSWTSSKGDNSTKGDKNSATEKTVNHKVLQCQGMFYNENRDVFRSAK